MSEIKFVPLNKLLNKYPQHIELIKEKYLKLLSELTVTSNLNTGLFKKNIEKINRMGKIIIAIKGDINSQDNDFEIVASGTIVIEPKILRGGQSVGHIEDIVVLKEFRGKNISQELLNILKIYAMYKNCYKVILDCSEEVKNVYIKNGFEVKDVHMVKYF